MKKTIITVIAIILLIVLIAGGIVFFKMKNTEETSSTKFETVQDMENLINNIYEKTNPQLFGLETRELDITDEMTLTSYTGLQNSDNVESVVVSESMITSRAYSLVMVKTKNNADIEAMKQEIFNNIDMRRWICVSAEVAYITNCDDVIFLVMSTKENAKPQYEAFKELTNGKIGKELVKEEEEPDFNFDENVEF